MYLLTLLENPNLLEHDRFTDLLWTTTHLDEELEARPSLDNLPEDRYVHILKWKGYKIHSGFRDPAHGIDITQGIGSGDLPEPVGIVHDGRKEIHRLDNGEIIRDFINPGVVSAIQSYDHVRIRWEFNPAQCPVQVPWRQF